MITDAEFQAILDDESKRIEGDISWSNDEFHSPAQKFQVPVLTASGDPLRLNGWYNRYTGKLSFTLIRQDTGRIYGLDIGFSHGRQQSTGVYAKHKHHWSEARRDKNIYYPDDITASVEHPVEVWQQFCTEARIEHKGMLREPQVQGILDL